MALTMQQTQHKFIFQQLFGLLIAFILLMKVFPIAGALDQHLIQAWVGQSGTFPYRHSWALSQLNHQYVKDILLAVFISWFGLYVASFKLEHIRFERWRYLYLFLLVIVTTSFIGLLKSQSSHSCPWNMLIPSGTGFVFDVHAGQGHCFPGGHAATGFALLVGYFAYRDDQPQRAYFYLCSSLILGFAMGWAQMMRGAHFLSHNLWTCWIIWLSNVLAYALIYLRLPKFSQSKLLTEQQIQNISPLIVSHRGEEKY